MTDLPPPFPQLVPLPPPPMPDASPVQLKRRPSATAVVCTVIAWNLIVLICLGLPMLRAERKAATTPSAPTTQPQSATSQPAKSTGSVDLQTKLYGRYMVGTAAALPGSKASMSSNLAEPSPTVEGRIGSAIVAGEIVGRDEAIRRLKTIDDPAARTFQHFYERSTSSSAVKPATAPTTVPAGVVALEGRFDWFARLAESYGRPDSDPLRAEVLSEAIRTMITVVAALILLGGAILAGWALFNTAIVLLALGKLSFAVRKTTGPWHVYIESFAIYLGGFIISSLIIQLLFNDPSLAVQFAGLGVVVIIAALWPIVRGVPFATLRKDWGIHTGRNVFVEMVAGVSGYLAGLPIILVGVGLTAVIAKFAQADTSHPINNEIDSGTWLTVLTLYFGASVFAPLTEELLFRGALVSHLRAGFGVVAAAAFSGLIFASVHPQGWAAIPALGSIGMVLALIRQWRGSLVASMTAHALNNTFVITLLVLATR